MLGQDNSLNSHGNVKKQVSNQRLCSRK